MIATDLKFMKKKRRELIKKYNLALDEDEDKANKIGRELIKVDKIISNNS